VADTIVAGGRETPPHGTLDGHNLIPAVAGCLQERDAKGADSDTKPGHLVPVAMINMQGSKGNSVAQDDGPSYTLNAMHGYDVHAVAVPVAFHENQRAEVTCNDTVGALKCTGGKPGQGYPAVAVPVAFQSSQSGVRVAETHATLDANNGPRRHNGALVGMQVRRLTPIETERLQALPDNWTLIPWRGKPAEDCPDGPRYKGVGNGQTVTVMKWLADRIRKGLDTL